MRRLLPILPLIAALAWPRAGARLAAPDRDVRGAARAALGLHARGHARPDHRLRRHPRPPARLLARLRARSRQQDAPELRRERPERLSRRQVGQPRRADRRRQGARRRGHADAHRPGAALGDARQEGQPLLSGPEGVRRVRDRDRAAATATRSSTWSIWNEPNQPQFLKPQYKSGKPYSPKLYRKLYQAAYAGLRSTPANADDTILIGETSPRGNANVVAPARVPARDAVPGLQVPQGEVLRRARGRRLRAPRVHDERRPALQARATPTT